MPVRATAVLSMLWLSMALPGAAGAGEREPPNAPLRSTETTPWTAAEHLGPRSDGLTAPGWWLELGSVSREAVSAEWEGSVRGGFTGSAFPGVVLGWRWVGGGGSTPTHDRELRLVLPWKQGRVDAGVRFQQRDARHAFSIPVQVLVRTGAFVIGSRTAIHPGRDAGSADASLVAAAAHDRWLGALEVGPGPGAYRASLGLRITGDVLWLVHVADLDPTTGVHLRLGRFEIRAETTPHRVLGTTVHVRIVWTGAAT